VVVGEGGVAQNGGRCKLYSRFVGEFLAEQNGGKMFSLFRMSDVTLHAYDPFLTIADIGRIKTLNIEFIIYFKFYRFNNNNKNDFKY
jgi:hypothetical protein